MNGLWTPQSAATHTTVAKYCTVLHEVQNLIIQHENNAKSVITVNKLQPQNGFI